MELNNFEIGPIRPPDEADSLLIRTTRGCPWNRCHYCTLFKDMRFSIRSVEEIKEDIFAAHDYYSGATFETCFLQDGDSFAMKTKDLLEVLQTLKNTFPSINRISSYGRAQTMGRKSESEIQEIHDAGLNMLYCGIESGSDKVLEKIRKGVTAESIINSTLKGKNAGMNLVVFVIFGLGGRELSTEHIKQTATVLNRLDPYNIRVMSLAVKTETGLGKMISDDSFTMLSELEIIEEQRSLITQLEGIHSLYSNSHSVNLLNEIVGTFPDDKQKLLGIIDTFLSYPEEKMYNYILGKRQGYYHRLTDLDNSNSYNFVQNQLEQLRQTHSGESLDTVFHNLRNRVI